MAAANSRVGERVTAEVAAQTGGAPLSGASALGLASPIDVKTTV